MDRFAAFVDAGYLYASGGKVVCGTKARAAFDFDSVGFMDMLLPKVRAMSDLPLLRSYWYDGAKRGIPTVEQQTIAAIPNLKLRLGRLNSRNQQKGVDALIYHDLITLASSRAISDAFLLSGDEDLREGVRAAQNLGVRVSLIGVDEGGKRNQSPELCDEVDEHLTLSGGDLGSFFQLLPTSSAPGTSASAPATTSSAPGTTASPPTPPSDPTPLDLSVVALHGRAFGEAWVDKAFDDEIDSLRADRPKIPRTVDVDLVRHAETEMGLSFRGQDAARRELRKAFWDAVGLLKS